MEWGIWGVEWSLRFDFLCGIDGPGLIFFGFMSEERVEEGKWAIYLLSGWGGVHVVGKGRGWKRKGGLGFI